MIVRVKLDKNRKLTEEEKAQIRRAASLPIVYDEDCPKLTKEQLKQFKHYSQVSKINRQKETISLRVTKSAKQRLKALGKGYTGVISRLIEYALNNPSILKKCL